MYAPERQQEILRLARDGGGRVDVLSPAEEPQATAETIRGDLNARDRAGPARGVYGGRSWRGAPTSSLPSLRARAPRPARSTASPGQPSPDCPARAR
jgi:DeoR/GlpR family transcriptional regulator of sugar metabolism